MTSPCRRPWWRRKRWWAAGLLWLAALYPLGAGPATYCVMRGWLPPSLFVAYRPLGAAVLFLERHPDVPAASAVAGAYQRYATWWRERGAQNATPLPAPVTSGPAVRSRR